MLDFTENIAIEPSTIVISVVISVVMYVYLRPPKRLPPGPTSLPLFGTIFSHKIVLSPEELCKLGEKFGDIFMINVFSHRLVVLNSYEAIKEATIKKPFDFVDRKLGHGTMNMSTNPNMGGMLFKDFDEKAKRLRNTSRVILRNLGAGRSIMEQKISEEAKALVSIFESQNKEAFEPLRIVTSCVTNVMLHIMLNKRHDYDEKELNEVIDCGNNFTRTFRLFTLVDPLPFLRYIPPIKNHFENFVKCNRTLVNYVWKHSQPIIYNFQPGKTSNFVSAYLDSQYDKDHESTTFDEDEFKFLLRDFLLAGTETTAISLQWTLLYLTNKPRVQEKLQKQLDCIVGREREYSFEDKVPYLDAVIWEVQRYSSLAPLAAPHAVSTKADAELAGYVIPKDSMVFLNLYAVHHNKATWGDPENFRPERFLDENGNFVRHPHVIPFSIGKRSCIGELLARQELYIFTAALFQRFTFLPSDGVEKIDSTPGLGFTRHPKSYLLRAIPRN